MKEGTLKFLGRGSAFNAKEGNNSAYYIDEFGCMLLIDCGSTVFSRIIELELLKDVNTLAIIITHMHQDHCGSISTLLEYVNAVYPTMKVKVYSFRNIYCPKNYTFELMGIRNGLNKNIEFEERIIYEYLHHHGTLITLPLNFGNSCVHFIMSDHNASICRIGEDSSNLDISSVMLYFKIGDKTIFYTSDIKKFSPEWLAYDPFIKDIKLVDEWYIDAAVRTEFNGNKYPHANIYDTYKKCIENEIPIERVWLMHLDCDGVEIEGKELGFNIVENI